jgi:hypothetical protein
MQMGLTKLKNSVPDRDRVVIIDQNGTADIAIVYDREDNALYAESDTEDYAVPLADVTAFVGPHGRIYLMNADSDYVADSKRLAALEKSIVLRHVTHFAKPPVEEGGGLNMKKILMYVGLFALIMIAIFK